MVRRASLSAVLVLLLLTTASAGASGWRAAAAGSSAQAYGIRVVVPGQTGGETPTVAAPPDAVQFSGSFAYPTGGTAPIVTTGSANASVSAVSGPDATASASAEVSSLSIFGGEIAATSIVARAQTSAKPGAATGDTNGTAITGLVALGQPVSAGASIALADWGTLRTTESASTNDAAAGYHGTLTALDIHLTADHGGLPAGTSILVGYAEVAALASPPAPPAKAPGPRPRPKRQHAGKPAVAPEPSPFPTTGPPNITPPLKTPGGHVFPVFGPSSYTDSFGAPRGDVSGGWHHGDDIFAPLGAPILAVSSGTVFSVGWNEVGGNRLWVRDGAGNEYYYAHLSAYTPLARNGNVVNAGDVLGFVGNTGDAQGTPYHLHFEIHPVGLLGLGYDGAVDPTTYLTAWKHLQDVSFAGGYAWAPFHGSSRAPKAGAILISANDISSADGLDPKSLVRAMAPSSTEGTAATLAATAPAERPKRKPAGGQQTAAGSYP